tara:strand:- start:393 stop:731 length:339 start_codon:yes stop_codon:yes gene_type:complete
MTATVDIVTNKKKNVVGVPISAIVIKSDTTGTKRPAKNPTTDERFEAVFLKRGDEAVLQVVQTGIQDDSNIEITKGISTGDVVITGPYNTVTKSLKPGDKVVIESEEQLEDQ